MRKMVMLFGIGAVLIGSGCSGTTGVGVPSGGPAQPGQINPLSASPGAPATGAVAVDDPQSVDDVAKWYLASPSTATPDPKLAARIEARAKFDATISDPAPPTAAAPLNLTLRVPLPAGTPDPTVYALSVPVFSQDDSAADKLAQSKGVARTSNVVTPKKADQQPQDNIVITKGRTSWTIDRLTGLITFTRTHNDGELPVDVKQAQTAAETFVTDHGGMPDDAVLGDPAYDLTKGSGNGAPKPRRITFTWHHKDPSIFGNDVLSVDVTANSASGGTPATQAQQAWGVTRMSRLWRTRGKPIDKASTLLAPDAAFAKLKDAAIPALTSTKPIDVTGVAFGEYREPGNVAQVQTRPVWDFVAGGAHYDVDAQTGAVLNVAPPAPSSSPSTRAPLSPNPKGTASASPAASPSGSPANSASPSASPAPSPAGTSV